MALALVLSLRPRLSGPPADPLVFWVPFGFHVYCLGAGLLSLALLRPPVLLLVSLAMMGLALYLHRSLLCALAAAKRRPVQTRASAGRAGR